MAKGTIHHLATGVLTWHAVERRSDRYGTIYLTSMKSGEYILFDSGVDKLESKYGILFAKVVFPVVSHHVGDLRRKIYPSLPSLGEVVTLGVGELFVEHVGRAPREKSAIELADEELMAVFAKKIEAMGGEICPNAMAPEDEIYDLLGVHPREERKNDWMDPKALYRVHSSGVELHFQELE